MSRSLFAASAVLAVVSLLFAAPAALAQSQATTGVIVGRVLDPDQAPLPGATVTVVNAETGYTRSIVTETSGRFVLPLLPLGSYEITVALDGFATFVRQGLSVSLGQRAEVDVELVLATVREEVTVTAPAPLIETTRTNSSTTLDEQVIEGLPNNGRNFLDFTLLTPGVAIAQGPDGNVLTVNGQKGIQNNIAVDGADFNNPFFGEQRGGQRPPFTFNLDAIQEVVVVASGGSAEFGRSSGGFVQVVTKSGTNEVRGTVHAFLKDDSASATAKLLDGSLEPDYSFEQQQVGFTLGGPITQNESFFFIATDFQRSKSTRQTDSTRIEQRVVDAFAALGSPNENGPIERTDDARALLGKIDYQLDDTSRATLRYAHTWSEQANGTFDVGSWGVSANAVERDFSNAVSGQVVSAFDKTYNELRFQWAREDRPRPYEGAINPATGRPFPDTAFDFGRQYRFGMPFFIPVEYNDTRVQVNDNLSVVNGEHSVKFGGEYNRTNATQTFIGFANGRYIFGSTDGFLNYVNNPAYVECSDGSSSQSGVCPAGASIVGPVLLYLQQAGVGGLSVEEAGTQAIIQHEYALFVQDTWQASDNLVLDLGLRWEAQKQPPLITPISELFYAPFIGQTKLGQEFPGDGTIPSDWGMFQPRFGFAWTPGADGRTLVRGSAGIYSARIPGLNLASSRSTDGSRGQTLFRASFLNNILGNPPAYGELIPQSEIGDPFQPGVFVFDKNFQNPETYAYSLSVEHEVAPDVAVDITANYSRTVHLTRFADRNDPLLGSPWSSGLGAGGFNGVGVLTTVESSARSRYYGLTFGLRKNFVDDYGFQFNYTLGWDKSDDDNERDPFSFRYAKITDLGPEFSWSDRDQRHRLNGYFVAQLPGQVDFNARYSYRSAQPKSITASGADAFTPQDRINPDGSVTARNLGRKDNTFSSLDVRFAKDFVFDERSLQVIFEVFNVFNATNILAPATTNLVFNFDGTVRSGAGAPRVAQLGARFVF